MAHDVAAQILECHFHNPLERATMPVGYTSEMGEAVRVYTDFIKKQAKTHGCVIEEGHVLIEQKFDLSSVYPGLFGTSDATLYNPDLKKLIVVDYKHGAGLPVGVEGNLQLQYYGLGALLASGFPCATVELVIVQPRCNHPDGAIRKWEFPSTELLTFAATLAEDAKRTENPGAPRIPGDHCRFCPAAAVKCEALKAQAQSIAKVEFKDPQSYDPVKLSEALDMIPTVEAWIKRTREFAYQEALHNRAAPGWKLVDKRASRKWKAADKEIFDFMVDMGASEDDIFERKIKSPAQMEKALPKKDRGELDQFIVKQSTGTTLVHESDKRPAAALTAQSDFKEIEG